MLTSLIHIPDEPGTSPEDIFSSALDLLFPDAQRTFHGNAGSDVIYMSKNYGAIKLLLTDPQGRDERMLFAHHLWNSSILMAEIITLNATLDNFFSVVGETVLELGAGGRGPQLNLDFEAHFESRYGTCRHYQCSRRCQGSHDIRLSRR